MIVRVMVQVDVDNEALILLPLQGEMQALSQRYAGMVSVRFFAHICRSPFNLTR